MGKITAASPTLFRATKTTTTQTTVGTTTLFTVTGEVLIEAILGYVSQAGTADAGTGTVTATLGVTGSVSLFIGSMDWILLLINTFYVDATPDANGIALPAAMKDIVITDNILLTVSSSGSKLPTAGIIRFDVLWRPLSANGNIA